MTQEVIHGDCRDVLQGLPDASVDSVVTDPPYELGFMGRAWDASGIAYSVDMWREVFRVLKPGGHLLAFGGTRTVHRLTCAIEDAGFEIRDGIDWIYGSGFPKSLNVGDGWGTALKPAREPIVMARKPLTGTVAATVLAYGTGALNIDACRVATADDLNGGAYAASGRSRALDGDERTGAALGMYEAGRRAHREYEQPPGRWPANVILSHAPDCDPDEYECLAGCPVGGLGESARFFPVFRYQAKAPTRERPKVDGVAHPTVKPLALMRWLVQLVTPPGGTVLDPFAGSGATVEACLLDGFRCVAIEKEAAYLPLIQARMDRAAA